MIILSLEQNKTDIPTIRAVRVAAMGPLGGIGDALFWFTLVPITAGITSNMAIDGNIAGPFIFLLVFNIAQFAIRWYLMHWSYKLGTNAISVLTENAKEFTRAASILGIFIVGSLTCVYGSAKLGLEIPNGTTNEATAITTVVSKEGLERYGDKLYVDGDEATFQEGSSVKDLGTGDYQITYNKYDKVPVNINIQNILDGILPQIIPLALTLLLYLLMAKKNFTPLKCIGLLLILGLLGSGLGIWPTIWPQ